MRKELHYPSCKSLCGQEGCKACIYSLPPPDPIPAMFRACLLSPGSRPQGVVTVGLFSSGLSTLTLCFDGSLPFQIQQAGDILELDLGIFSLSGTLPLRTPMETMQLVPPSHADNLQAVQGISANFIQSPGSIKSVQYVQYQGSFGNPPQQFPQLGALGKAVLRHAKALGAIQIIIGLLHICFTIYLCFTVGLIYVWYSEIWSGIIFVASGSVSVSAKKHMNSNLVNCSVGMNTMSAVVALLGIVLNVILLALYNNLWLASSNYAQLEMGYPHYNSAYSSVKLLYAFLIVFLLLKLVQFCTVVLVAHFGCRTNCCTDDVAIAYVPCTTSGGYLSPIEDYPAHLTYVKVVPYMEVW